MAQRSGMMARAARAAVVALAMGGLVLPSAALAQKAPASPKPSFTCTSLNIMPQPKKSNCVTLCKQAYDAGELYCSKQKPSATANACSDVAKSCYGQCVATCPVISKN